MDHKLFNRTKLSWYHGPGADRVAVEEQPTPKVLLTSVKQEGGNLHPLEVFFTSFAESYLDKP